MAYKDPEKQKKFAREWCAKRRKDWFDKNGPCVKCGSWDRLELDHIIRKTKVSHCVWSWSKEKREIELAKCQPLCHFCHKEKTRLEKSKFPDHGKYAKYIKGCRCKLCNAANARRTTIRRYDFIL